MAEYYHSVVLDEKLCMGCTNCIKRCPTEAIRVHGGKARIFNEKCIDCGEWFEVDSNDGMTCRCPSCLKAYKRERDRIRKQKYRMSHEVQN